MTHDNDGNAHRRQLADSLRSARYLKYIVLITITFVIIYFISRTTDGFDFSSLQGNVLVAAVTALAITLVQDIFLKREQDLLDETRRAAMAESLSREILGRYGISIIPDDQLQSTVTEICKNRKILQLMAAEASKNPRSQNVVVDDLFHTIWSTPILEGVSIRSKLVDFSSDMYEWTKTVSFVLNKSKKRFRVVFANENAIATEINTAHLGVDATIYTSIFEESIMNQIKASRISLLHKVFDGGGLRKREILAAVFCQDYKSRGIDIDEGRAGRVAVIDFDIGDVGSNAQLEFSFRARNRYEDCFFYEVIATPSFVESIEVDYSAIKGRLGKVSLIELGPSRSSEMTPDRELGVVRLDANGQLLWPGQGIVMVWRGSGFQNGFASEAKEVVSPPKGRRRNLSTIQQ